MVSRVTGLGNAGSWDVEIRGDRRREDIGRMEREKPDPESQDPEEFLRALLKVSPEDAAKAREAADTKADSGDD